MGKYDKKTAPRGEEAAPRIGEESSPRESQPQLSAPIVPDNPELDEIAAWLKTVRFRKKGVGGLDPDDVWRKIDELNRMYEMALAAERSRYNVLLHNILRKTRKTPPEGSHGKK